MSDERRRDEPPGDEPGGEDRPDDFDWGSPRWRSRDEHQGDAEREHRFRDDGAPPERGAIDREGSVGGGRTSDRNSGEKRA